MAMILQHLLQVSNLDTVVKNDGDLLQWLLDSLVDSVGGEGLFAVLIGGTLIFTLYMAGDGDTATPVVATILLGGIMVGILPGAYQQIAWAIVVLGIAAGIMSVATRYILSGAAGR